jgi:hypothetical protein
MVQGSPRGCNSFCEISPLSLGVIGCVGVLTFFLVY